MFGNLIALGLEFSLLVVAMILEAGNLPEAVLAIGKLVCLSNRNIRSEHDKKYYRLKYDVIKSEPWLDNSRGFCVCRLAERSV